MIKQKQLICLTLCCVMLFGLLNGCGKNTAAAPTTAPAENAATENNTIPDHPYGGHVNVRITGITGLDPLTQTGYSNYQWTTLVFENALTRDLEDNIQPGVCDYAISDDKCTLTLWVREGMLFHNGDTVDIYDVEASLNRAFTRYSSIKSKVVPFVKSMEVAPDGKTLTLQFTQWREDIYYYLASYRTWCAIMPKEICESYTEISINKKAEDCIGTGPYKVSDYKRKSYITLERFEDYVVQYSDRTGFAGPKYAYLDSITFWNISDDSNAVQGLLSGKFDSVDCMLPEFAGSLESHNIASTTLDTNTGWYVYFNTNGKRNITAKYPSLRKAVMASIDTEELLKILTHNQYTADATPILDGVYDIETFQDADYYGAANQDVVKQYLAEAKAAGWNGTDPIVLVPFGNRTDAETYILDCMSDAGIPCSLVENEDAKNANWRKKAENQWDIYFHEAAFPLTPTLTQDVILNTYWNSIAKDTLVIKMKLLEPGTADYMDLWTDFAQLWVDDCAVPFLGLENSVLYHKDTLHINEDKGSLQRYWFNAYWDDPENHTA